VVLVVCSRSAAADNGDGICTGVPVLDLCWSNNVGNGEFEAARPIEAGDAAAKGDCAAGE